jgi:hypothetical protein
MATTKGYVDAAVSCSTKLLSTGLTPAYFARMRNAPFRGGDRKVVDRRSFAEALDGECMHFHLSLRPALPKPPHVSTQPRRRRVLAQRRDATLACG